jgi:hypothetical protein
MSSKQQKIMVLKFTPEKKLSESGTIIHWFWWNDLYELSMEANKVFIFEKEQPL